MKARHAAAVPVLALLGTACLGSSHGAPTTASDTEQTALTVSYWEDSISSGDIVHRRSPPLTLRCSPPGGTLPEPDVACFAIATDRARYFGQPSAGCIGPPLRWSVHIKGKFRGQHVRRVYDMCDYPEARAWTDLGGTDLVGIVSVRSVVRVPDVGPAYVTEAIIALKAAGLRVAIPTTPPIRHADASVNGFSVLGQTPEPGTRVALGSIVVLRVAPSANGGPGGLGPAGIVPRLTAST
jgi:hypothetical protein